MSLSGHACQALLDSNGDGKVSFSDAIHDVLPLFMEMAEKDPVICLALLNHSPKHLDNSFDMRRWVPALISGGALPEKHADGVRDFYISLVSGAVIRALEDGEPRRINSSAPPNLGFHVPCYKTFTPRINRRFTDNPRNRTPPAGPPWRLARRRGEAPGARSRGNSASARGRWNRRSGVLAMAL